MSATAETIIDFDVERRWRDAREAYDAARSSTVAFGRIMAELRQQYPRGTWGAELGRRGFNHSHVADAIRQASDPAYAAKRNSSNRGRKSNFGESPKKQAASSERSAVADGWTKEQWEQAEYAAAFTREEFLILLDAAAQVEKVKTAMPGEGHEAWQQLKAYSHRAVTRATNRGQYYASATGCLQKLIELCGMSLVAGASVEEIMKRIKLVLP